MTDMLTVQGLTKRFGSRTVLHNLSFSLRTGTALAITGRSGCGKSTLLNIIGMLEAPSSGTVLLRGTGLPAINSARATRLRRNSINYLFQSYALISDKTATENALLGLHFARLSRAEKLSRLAAIFERLGLSAVKNEKVSTLSGGEQQRLALARCILKPGDLILADEPTGALDPQLAQTVLSEMLALQRDFRKTLVIVTHDPLVAQQCDEVLELLPHG
jgi:putative ABC transport system ATP-binding protein